MLGEKSFHARQKVYRVGRASKAVALICVHHISRRAAVLLDRSHDLFGFGLLDARVVGAQRDQQRNPDSLRRENGDAFVSNSLSAGSSGFPTRAFHSARIAIWGGNDLIIVNRLHEPHRSIAHL